MVKISTALAILVVLAAGAVALPYSSQAEASQDSGALPKGDKLSLAACVNQTWPNLSAICLRGGPAAKTAIRTVTPSKSYVR